MIKSLKRYIAFCMVLLMTILSFHIDALAADQYKGGIVIEDDTPKVVEEGLMPSTGDVKAAVLMVEFSDVKASVSKDNVNNTIFGESDSVSNYYKNSSYGKLNISGDVYDWYASPNNREYYEDNTREYPPNEYLFREVLNAMDNQVDFSQYDSDNDGYVDMVYLVYAGQDEGYKSLWWAYMDELIGDVEVDGKKIKKFVIMPEKFDYLTAAHETGHAMGLQDYYDTSQGLFGGSDHYGTYSLMCTSSGDLDVLSKWMLGWLTPQIITDSSAISLRPINEYPDAAVIKVKNQDIEESFFVVEYRTPTMNYQSMDVGGVSIFRVNAQTDSVTSHYKYDVSKDELKLIEKVAVDLTSGYGMGMTQLPNSYIVQEDGENVKYMSTGISVDNIAIASGKASMSIAYGDINITGNIAPEKTEMMSDTRIGYMLSYPVGVSYVGGEIVATNGDKSIPVRVYRNNYVDQSNKNEYYLYTSEDLESNTTYTIEIPEGMFIAFDGRTSEKEVIKITTSSYGVVKAYPKDFGHQAYVSNTYPYGEGGFVYFTNEDGKIYMKTVDEDGTKGSKLLYDMGQLSTTGALYSSVLQSCLLDNGYYVLSARDNSNNAIIKVSPAGVGTYIGNIQTTDNMMCSSLGNKALLGRKNEQSYIILDENSKLVTISDTELMTPIGNMGDKYYALTGMKHIYNIYNKDMVMEGSIIAQENRSYLGLDIADNQILTSEYEYVKDAAGKYNYYICNYQLDGTLKSQGIFYSAGVHEIGYTDMYNCSNGYVFVGAKDLAISDDEATSCIATATPVAHIKVTDKNFKEIYTCTFDWNGTGNGDSITGVVELSNGNIVCSTPWCDYVLKAPTKADQHSHSYGNDNVCDICGYTKLANEGGSSSITIQPGVVPSVNVYYRTHIQTFGWEGEAGKISTWKQNGAMSGTSGKSKRLEGIEIEVASAESGKDVHLGIQYTTHCQSYGWLPWSASGEMSGTSGEAKRLEAIMIQLTGADADKYDVYYRVHAQSYGWLGWAKNGEPSGTAGYGKRLEGIQIVVVKKGESLNEKMGGITSKKTEAYVAKSGSSPVLGQASTDALNPVINGADAPYVMYKTHVQSFGWQKWVYNGTMSGTSGKSKRLEGINIKLSNAPYEGDIVYTTHVQKYGWKDGKPDADQSNWKKNGEMSGTSGEAKRLEAICINLTGEMAEHYDVYYRVHAQTFGWLGWAKNGEESGTAGYAKRLEGIQIVLVEKGGEAPGKTYGGITSKDARAYIEKK